MRHSLFIADLHLQANRPDITACFIDFLQHQAPQADALYILGDFFEVWIGDDETSLFHQAVIAALKQLTDSGLPIYLMRGNRDFLLGTEFMRQSGCHFLPDPSLIELYGNKVLLTHGDALCTADIKHQNFRKYTQNPYYTRLFLWLPLVVRRAIAQRIRQASQRHTADAAYSIMDVAQPAVEQQMRQQQVTQLLHGHTHRQALHEFSLDGQPACRMVLNDWHNQGGALVYEATGKVYFRSLPFKDK